LWLIGLKDSDKIINSVLTSIKKNDLDFQLKNRFDFTGKSLENWKRIALYATKHLHDSNVDYLLIKAYDIPFAIMDDVDILIENQKQLRYFYDKLIKSEFIFKHIPFNDQLKLSAINSKLNIEIDFYPDSKWGELRYAKKYSLSSNKINNTKHRIQTFTPNPEHEIYIVASHSYYHGRINLLEILNTVKIILDQNPNLSEIITLAKAFHLQNGTLILFSKVNQLLKNFGFDIISKSDLKELRDVSHQRFRNLSKTNFELFDFPIQFSIGDILAASLSKFTASNLDKSASRFDELNVFLKHNRIVNYFYSKFVRKYEGFIPN